MKIGMDARLLINRRGMGNYVYNLLMELAELPGDERDKSTPHGDTIYFESRMSCFGTDQ